MSVGSRLGSRRPVCMPRAEPEAGDPVSALREPPTHDAYIALEDLCEI